MAEGVGGGRERAASVVARGGTGSWKGVLRLCHRRRSNRHSLFLSMFSTAAARPPLTCSELDYEIVVIDDNSPDGTQEVALELQRLFGEDR